MAGYSQTRDTASVFGTVTDAQAAFIPGASITLTNVDTGLLRKAEANESDGFCSLRFGWATPACRRAARLPDVRQNRDAAPRERELQSRQSRWKSATFTSKSLSRPESHRSKRGPPRWVRLWSQRAWSSCRSKATTLPIPLLSPGVVPAWGSNTGDSGFTDVLRPQDCFGGRRGGLSGAREVPHAGEDKAVAPVPVSSVRGAAVAREVERIDLRLRAPPVLGQTIDGARRHISTYKYTKRWP
jgi:hypothetical protein